MDMNEGVKRKLGILFSLEFPLRDAGRQGAPMIDIFFVFLPNAFGPGQCAILADRYNYKKN